MAVFNILCENKATYEYQYTLALQNGKCRDSNILTYKFKFYDEYNRLAEKTETKWTSLNGTLIS